MLEKDFEQNYWFSKRIKYYYLATVHTMLWRYKWIDHIQGRTKEFECLFDYGQLDFQTYYEFCKCFAQDILFYFVKCQSFVTVSIIYAWCTRFLSRLIIRKISYFKLTVHKCWLLCIQKIISVFKSITKLFVTIFFQLIKYLKCLGLLNLIKTCIVIIYYFIFKIFLINFV